MKRTVKLTAIFLAFILFCSTFFAGCNNNQSEPINAEQTYSALTGLQSDWISNNPDRGYRTEIVIDMYSDVSAHPEYQNTSDWRYINVNDSETELNEKVQRLVEMYVPENTTLAIAYIFFEDCNRLETIPESYLRVLDMFFDYCRVKNIRIIWRHAYTASTTRYIVNPEDKEYLARVCADEETMIRHIKQLGPYIGKHLDIIQKVSSGVIGNGEFVASFQWPPVDFNNVLYAIVEEMCVPNGLQFSIRMPRYKTNALNAYKEKTGEDYPYADYIGFNNDAVYGETDKRGYHSGCWQYNHKTCGESCFNLKPEYYDEWAYVTANAAYFSQSGEMFTNGPLFDANTVPTGINVIKQMAHHRFTTLSHWHTLHETDGDNVMKRWIENEVVTPEILDSLGIIYDPNWFYDPDGNEIIRNPYEFLKDHLGYKLVADKSKLVGEVGKGCKVTADLSFKNYGFAAPFFLESGFAVLDSKYEVVSEVNAGNPEEWISLPADYYVTERTSSVQDDIIQYNVSAELTLPEESGKYYIAFYLKNSAGSYAGLSNDLTYENGFNILYQVEVK